MKRQLEQLTTAAQSVTVLDGTYLAVIDQIGKTVTIFNTATLP
jgi:hypothetical protein